MEQKQKSKLTEFQKNVVLWMSIIAVMVVGYNIREAFTPLGKVFWSSMWPFFSVSLVLAIIGIVAWKRTEHRKPIMIVGTVLSLIIGIAFFSVFTHLPDLIQVWSLGRLKISLIYFGVPAFYGYFVVCPFGTEKQRIGTQSA